GGALEEAIRRTVDLRLVAGRAARALEGFLTLMSDLRREAAGAPPGRLVASVLSRTAFAEYLEKSSPQDAAARVENLEELVSAVAGYDDVEGGLQAFLDRAALLSETENVQGTAGVNLMTLHSAKGLEFPVVFIAGLEEDLFPHVRSAESPDDIEEERRLFYVGMTRAKERLILSRALMRRLFGEARTAEPSRFLREIPEPLLRQVEAPYPTGAPVGGEGRVSTFGARRGRRSGADRPLRSPEEAEDPVFEAEREPEGPYTLGCKVHHPEYGVGTVIGVEGAGEGLKLTVSFSIYGSKKFLPRFAQLEKI
ncbi:MAG TPA: 3'-5' exonuclease, partial [Candidatus Polarisedimenticolia bacterium]|nr:3'-5' exonuclease [Candidatus Polarisedimenticolia bacterium]